MPTAPSRSSQPPHFQIHFAVYDNKYMGDKFNPKEDRSYLQYLDANNLYGWAMIQKFPTGGFNWADLNEFTPDKIDS